MDITINGQAQQVAGAQTLAQLIAQLKLEDRGGGLAVCVNGEVVRRTAWDRPLAPGDEIEIVQATQGG